MLCINRFGRVHTKKMTPNQCKEPGQTTYDYHLRVICCDTNLDNNRFIIEHSVIDKQIRRLFSKTMDSCEIMVQKIAGEVEKVMLKNGVHIVDMYVKITPYPAPEVNGAFMEYSKSGKF